MIKPYIDIFDRFYVFDEADVNSRTFPATNFYFKKNYRPKNKDREKLFFAGGFSHGRYRLLEKLTGVLKDSNCGIDITLLSNNKEEVDRFHSQLIKVTNEHIRYEDYSALVNESSILLDIEKNSHNGLSFRIFDALAHDLKIITTNAGIKKYDFYNPSNCFVAEGDWEKDLIKFIETPYEPVPEAIKNKYSFSNWIRYVLNIPPFEEIRLPRAD